MPATLADSLRRLREIEQRDHRRRPFFAAISAHGMSMILGKQPQAVASAIVRATFRTTGLNGILDHPNGVTVHTTAPIASFGTMHTKVSHQCRTSHAIDRHSRKRNHGSSGENLQEQGVARSEGHSSESVSLSVAWRTNKGGQKGGQVCGSRKVCRMKEMQRAKYEERNTKESGCSAHFFVLRSSYFVFGSLPTNVRHACPIGNSLIRDSRVVNTAGRRDRPRKTKRQCRRRGSAR